MLFAPTRRIPLALALLLGACGMDKGPILEPDSGVDSGPEPDAGFDAGDVVAPTVVDATPSDGATDVAPDTSIVVRFSEPMADVPGTLAVTADGVPVALDVRTWSEDGAVLTVALREELPSFAHVIVTVHDDFEDRSGNALAAPYVFTFDVADTDPPTVVATTPAEGATGVPGRLDVIEITFDEPMSATGTLRIEGGPGEVGTPIWSTASVRFPVTGLAYETSYRIVLDGFTDAAGNALDGEPVLGDGAIDFTTGVDTDGPRVVDSNPDEGQVNVSLRFLDAIVVEFDEPMDTSLREAPLTVPGTVRTLTGTWSTDGRTITFPLAGELAPNGNHALDLSAFTDAAGNALDGAVHLHDGVLDFVTGIDDVVPAVVFATPGEGTTDTTFRHSFIRVVFNQAMDTSLTTMPLDDGVNPPVELTGTWNAAGTRITFNIPNMLRSGTSYRLDASAMRDATGRPLDVSHEYLGDGVLDFTTTTPMGENCRDALRTSEATETTERGFRWVIEERQVIDDDGSATCDTNGIPADAVIHYRKTTPAGGTPGGRWLRIRAQDSVGDTNLNNRINVEIFRGACEPEGPSASTARVQCLFDRGTWEVLIPAPPDDYFIWVSHHNGSTFREIHVTVEEQEDGPEPGDSCDNPLTVSSSSPFYTPPTAENPYHVWEMPEGPTYRYSYGTTNRAPDIMACDGSDSNGQGTDAVVRFDKAAPDSVLDVIFESEHKLGDGLNFQVLDTCDPRAPGATSLACFPSARMVSAVAQRRTWLRGDAGPFYFWTAAANSYYDPVPARVKIREVPASPGIDCSNAIRITPGSTVDVTPAPVRLFPPSCGPETANYTWYRVTATERALVVRGTPTDPTVNGALALIDPTTDAELTCVADIEGTFQSAFVEPGTDVCIAVESDRVASITVDAVPYDGLEGRITDLLIDRPLNSSGSERGLATSQWMQVTPTTVYIGVGTGTSSSSTSNFMAWAPRAGGVRAEVYDAYQGPVNGYAAAAVGEAIFVVDDLATAGPTPRLNRVISPLGTFEIAAWDTGTSYPAAGIRSIAYDGTSLWLASYQTSSPVTIWRASPTTPGPLDEVGTIPGINRVIAIAVDGTYMYLAATEDGGSEGIFRVPVADIGPETPAPTRIGTLNLPATRTDILLDDPVNPRNLYVRADGNAVHVIRRPAGTAVDLGRFAIVTGSNRPMAWDAVSGSIYIIDTANNDQRVLRVD